jgi:hypothetical protein
MVFTDLPPPAFSQWPPAQKGQALDDHVSTLGSELMPHYALVFMNINGTNHLLRTQISLGTGIYSTYFEQTRFTYKKLKVKHNNPYYTNKILRGIHVTR